jgi:hypothetical protein
MWSGPRPLTVSISTPFGSCANSAVNKKCSAYSYRSKMSNQCSSSAHCSVITTTLPPGDRRTALERASPDRRRSRSRTLISTTQTQARHKPATQPAVLGFGARDEPDRLRSSLQWPRPDPCICRSGPQHGRSDDRRGKEAGGGRPALGRASRRSRGAGGSCAMSRKPSSAGDAMRRTAPSCKPIRETSGTVCTRRCDRSPGDLGSGLSQDSGHRLTTENNDNR